MKNTTPIEYAGTYGVTTVGPTERLSLGGYVRHDLWRFKDAPVSMNRPDTPTHCTGPDDTSPLHSIYNAYDPDCNWCWLNCAHTEAAHQAELRKPQ